MPLEGARACVLIIFMQSHGRSAWRGTVDVRAARGTGRRHTLLGSPAPPLTKRARSIFISDPRSHHYKKHVLERRLSQLLNDITCCTRVMFRSRRLWTANKSMTPAESMRMCVLKCTGRWEIVSAVFRTGRASRSILRLPGGHIGTAILLGVEKGRAACVRRYANIEWKTLQVTELFRESGALQPCLKDYIYSTWHVRSFVGHDTDLKLFLN